MGGNLSLCRWQVKANVRAWVGSHSGNPRGCRSPARTIALSMSFALTAAGIVAVLIWLYLLLARGRFWRVHSLVASAPSAAVSPLAVAAIVPARNEAETIAASLTSLLRQEGSAGLRIIVVDDASSDGTPEAAREAARQAGGDVPVNVIEGRPLPPGWAGKLWAVQQGIEAARAAHPDFFLLTDADIRHAPDSLSTLIAIARAGRYDLVSLMVKLRAETFVEKLLIPAFVFFFFKLYPPQWVADPRRAIAGAAGGCILVRPAVLERAGGIAAVRSAIIDDCALAQAVKRTGGKLWLGLTSATESVRSYGSFAVAGRMIARTAFNQLRHSILLLIAALVGMAITYLLPLALFFSGQPLAIVLGASSFAMMTLSYVPMVRFYRLHPVWALTLPLAALFYMGATIVSAFDYWTGRGGHWKGRAQDRR